MATSALELSRTYTSYRGTDIKAVINGQPLATLQGISYAVQREKAPVYVMGSKDPLSFSRGKRGIAGTIIAMMFDEHALYKEAAFRDTQVILGKEEIYANPSSLNSLTTGPSGDLLDLGSVDPSYAGLNPSDLSASYQPYNPFYMDQLPPFDIVLVAQNEYGNAATMRIYGAEILNEGSGFSIDDTTIESQMTYVCRTILPWQKLGNFTVSGSGFSGGFTTSPVGPT